MQKILISLPDELASRMKLAIPNKKRSQVIAALLTREIETREKYLYEIACQVEADTKLNQEMEDWQSTSCDGIEHETW